MVTYSYNVYPAYYSTDHQDDGEWDRQTVLDPLWESQQKKTFTAWCNSHLRKAGTRINDLQDDFQSGLKLMLLLEVISGKRMPRPDRGQTRFHQIANVNKALDFIRSRGVKLVSLSAESIVDGNQKMILGLIWTLILRFAIQNITVGDLSARDGLLLWCQRKTEPYQNVDVQNFSNSWRDGLAFCALIHRHRPELIDYDSLSSKNPVQNLNLAFDVAEKHLDIPPMLDANDITYPSWPDEISTMTYVSSLYHAFETPSSRAFSMPPQPRFELNGIRSTRSLTPLRSPISPPSEPIIRHPQTPIRQMTPVHLPSPRPLVSKPIVLFPSDPRALEKAAKRVADELERSRVNKKLADDYDNMASGLLKWIDEWTPKLKNRSDDHSLDDAQKRLNEFRRYRLQEKPNKVEEKSDLENLHNRLQTQLKLADRPPFRPKDGQLLEDINNAWQKLEGAEKGFEEWLLSEVARLERLEHLAQKFDQKYAFYMEWADGKDDVLSSIDFKSADAYDLKCLRKKHEFFESEMANRQERVEQIIEIGKELARLRYPGIQKINKQCSKLCDNWQLLADLSTKRRQILDEMKKILEKLDDLHLKFACLASPFNNWASSTREDLIDIVIVTEMNEIKQLLADHNGFKETIPDADGSLKEILDLDQQIQSLVKSYGLDSSFLHNPYTDLTADQLSNLWTKVQNLIPRRDTELELELKRQKNNEHLKVVFVEQSNKLGPWLERQLETVLSIGMSGKNSDPQRMIDQLSLIRLEVQDKRADFNELEQISQQLQENFVFVIPGSKYTMQSLRVGIEALMTTISKVTNEFENQILIQQAKQKEKSQLNDYRHSFDHFNKSQKGLNEEQLRAFLVSIGQNNSSLDDRVKEITSQTKDNIDFATIMDHLNLGEKSASSQLKDAFKLLANGQSQIKAEDVRREFNSKQADECLNVLDSFFDHSTGQYNYDAFCRNLYHHN